MSHSSDPSKTIISIALYVYLFKFLWAWSTKKISKQHGYKFDSTFFIAAWVLNRGFVTYHVLFNIHTSLENSQDWLKLDIIENILWQTYECLFEFELQILDCRNLIERVVFES